MGGLLVGGGLLWYEGSDGKGSRILGDTGGEQLAASHLLSKYLEAYRCEICNAVFIYLSGNQGNSGDKNAEDEPLPIPDFWADDSKTDKPLEPE